MATDASTSRWWAGQATTERSRPIDQRPRCGPVLSDEQRREVAHSLAVAEDERQAIDPITETWPDTGIEDAYAIQLANIRRRADGGDRIGGFKVGLTSRAMQEMLGVAEPDYGHLLGSMIMPSGAVLERDSLVSPRVEVETAFVLARPLVGPGVTIADVLRATEFVLPAIEVIDSRIKDWRIALVDTVADNASAAIVVLGTQPTRLTSVDLRLTGAVLARNGEVVETGAGAAVLGHPAVAVAWLANMLATYEIEFGEGQVILPGSCTRALSVDADDSIRAEMSDLGSVDVTFV